MDASLTSHTVNRDGSRNEECHNESGAVRPMEIGHVPRHANAHYTSRLTDRHMQAQSLDVR